MRVSVVIPVYNEEESVLPLVEELAALESRLPGLEILLVDDGSTDNTWTRVVEAAAANPCVRGLRWVENQGQSAAMLAGLRAASGDCLATMDGDLQNNPADLPMLVEALSDCDVVCGYRATRKDTWSRRLASRIANAIRNSVTHDGIRDTGCSLKVFRAECLDDLPSLNGVHRFMPAYFRLHGRRIKEVAVDHRPRSHGVSKYTNLRRLPRGIRDLIGFAWYRKRYLRMTELETTADAMAP
jgi:dolichol-phosphate mannosyltransferase